jgi:hypothetical protein
LTQLQSLQRWQELLEIVAWSARYDKKTAAPKQFVSRIKNDKENLTNELISNLRKLKN